MSRRGTPRRPVHEGPCPTCGRLAALTRDGTPYLHKRPDADPLGLFWCRGGWVARELRQRRTGKTVPPAAPGPGGTPEQPAARGAAEGPV